MMAVRPTVIRDECPNCTMSIPEGYGAAELFDEIDRLRAEVAMTTHRLVLLDYVAHRAWHLMDDSGEVPDSADWVVSDGDHRRLSEALDALEGDGWTHPTEVTSEGN